MLFVQITNKAVVLPVYINNQAGHLLYVTIFYDCPAAPPGIFDSFTKIPSVSSDLKTRSYLDMFLSANLSSSADLR